MHDSFNVFTRKPCSTLQGILYNYGELTKSQIQQLQQCNLTVNLLVVKKGITALPFKKICFLWSVLDNITYLFYIFAKGLNAVRASLPKVRWPYIILLMLMIDVNIASKVG